MWKVCGSGTLWVCAYSILFNALDGCEVFTLWSWEFIRSSSRNISRVINIPDLPWGFPPSLPWKCWHSLRIVCVIGSSGPIAPLAPDSLSSPKGLRTESAKAVTGRRCPHSGVGEDFLARRLNFFCENGRNSETKSQKIVPKVGNEPPL